MPKPYSYDLRQAALGAIKLDGLKISEVSIIFNISRSTISLWLKRQSETGDFRSLPNKPPGNGNKITDWAKFREFAKTHGDKTQVEMAKLWEGEISDRTISRGLKKIGLSSKKRLMAFQERDEVKRKAFIAHLSSVPTAQIVYLDESGIDPPRSVRLWLE